MVLYMLWIIKMPHIKYDFLFSFHHLNINLFQDTKHLFGKNTLMNIKYLNKLWLEITGQMHKGRDLYFEGNDIAY